MTKNVFRLVIFAGFFGLLSGCYLKIITTEGGYIESASTYRDCPSGQACEVIVDTINFSETFTAIANPGYEFKGWASGPGFVCGSAGNVCNIALNYNPDLASIVHSERTGYLMPIFEKQDVSSQIVVPYIKDANGTIVGSIGTSYGYGSYEDIELNGMYSSIRVQWGAGYVDWDAYTEAKIYFSGDDCDLESPLVFVDTMTDTLPEVGPGKGFAKVHQQATHIFESMGAAGDFLVGSRWVADECEDIFDEVLINPYQVKWIAMDNFARPFTRHGPPPCSFGQVEGCY